MFGYFHTAAVPRYQNAVKTNRLLFSLFFGSLNQLCCLPAVSLSLSLAAYLLSFFRERVTSAAPRGHYCHGDTHDALHTADFQASRPPRGWVLTLYLAGRLWWNQLCWRRKKNNKQNRAERKTRVKVSEGPALLEFAKVAQVWGTLIC